MGFGKRKALQKKRKGETKDTNLAGYQKVASVRRPADGARVLAPSRSHKRAAEVADEDEESNPAKRPAISETG